jgi:hypothetical protein
MVTVTPGKTAPETSVTRPSRAPTVDSCPCNGMANSKAAPINTKMAFLCMFYSPGLIVERMKETHSIPLAKYRGIEITHKRM